MIGAFLTGCLQVFLVAYQTRQIAFGARPWRIVLVGIAISSVWVLNIRAAASGLGQGAAYALGAGCGTALALSFRMGGRREG